MIDRFEDFLYFYIITGHVLFLSKSSHSCATYGRKITALFKSYVLEVKWSLKSFQNKIFICRDKKKKYSANVLYILYTRDRGSTSLAVGELIGSNLGFSRRQY